MNMHVDETGRHDEIASINDLMTARCDAGLDRRDMPVRHEQIRATVQSARRIDHPPAANQQAHLDLPNLRNLRNLRDLTAPGADGISNKVSKSSHRCTDHRPDRLSHRSG